MHCLPLPFTTIRTCRMNATGIFQIFIGLPFLPFLDILIHGCVYRALPLRICVSICTYRTPLHECDCGMSLLSSLHDSKQRPCLCGAALRRLTREADSFSEVNHDTAHGVRYFSQPEMSLGRSDLHVGFKTASRLSSLRNVILALHVCHFTNAIIFRRFNIPISKDV